MFFLVVRTHWTREEEDELTHFFPTYLNGTALRKCPGRKECMKAINKSKLAVLKKRKWETIKKKFPI